jgi:hypothetical protein
MKTVLILGISGACRREALVKMRITNVEDKDFGLIEGNRFKKPVFTVSNLENINIFRKNRALRPSHASGDPVFLKYANGKCANQNGGINKIGEMPSFSKMNLRNLRDIASGEVLPLFWRMEEVIISIKRHGVPCVRKVDADE